MKFLLQSVSFLWHIVAIVTILSPVAVRAEIQTFNLVLAATSASIHYTNFYIRGPGEIDLSGIRLKAISERHNIYPQRSADDDAYPTDDKAKGVSCYIPCIFFYWAR
jgi:hypothetical protein